MSSSDSIPDRWKSCCTHDDLNVKGFFGPYRFLSNFHLCDIEYLGLVFPSTEHAYVYAKLENPSKEDYINIIGKSTADVKRYGRMVALRPDWEAIKWKVMMAIVSDKFSRHEDLKQKLIATGTKYIEETNSWGDVYWGVDLVNGGQNHLGKILMAVRDSVAIRDLFY